MISKKLFSEIVRLTKAFGYSFDGLRYAFTQPAFRIEVMACLVMMPLALWLADHAIERALLMGSLWLVLIVELLNTGIERAVDRVSGEWHELSKKAKDVASAAVLLSLLNAACIWLLILAG